MVKDRMIRRHFTRLPRLRGIPPANDVISAGQAAYEAAVERGGGVWFRLDLGELAAKELERRGVRSDEPKGGGK